MSIPDFEAIGRALDTAEPIQINLEPYQAFSLVSLLHLTLRHPTLSQANPVVCEIATSIIRSLTAMLGEIDPSIESALNEGWDESRDMTPQEYELYQQGQFEPGSNRSFRHLRQELKEEILAQSQVMFMALDLLSQHVGGSTQSWVAQLSRQSNYIINQMTPEQVDEAIDALEAASAGVILNIQPREEDE